MFHKTCKVKYAETEVISRSTLGGLRVLSDHARAWERAVTHLNAYNKTRLGEAFQALGTALLGFED